MKSNSNRPKPFFLLLFLVLILQNCATRNPDLKKSPEIKTEKSSFKVTDTFSGMASWYGAELNGNKTASGERFNMNDLTAAHRTLPFGTKVRVTFPVTEKSIVVRINDRGPFSRGRVIDLSRKAAQEIGLVPYGHGAVKVEVLREI